MAISGEKFLQVTQATQFEITTHALDRMYEHTGLAPTYGLASVFFSRSRHVKPEEMRLMGFRPGHDRRKASGIRSWYFGFKVFGQELIAVIAEGRETGSLTWITTYGPGVENEPNTAAETSSMVAA